MTEFKRDQTVYLLAGNDSYIVAPNTVAEMLFVSYSNVNSNYALLAFPDAPRRSDWFQIDTIFTSREEAEFIMALRGQVSE